MSSENKSSNLISGQVISTAMRKTIVIRVDRVVPHPLYGKYIRRSGKLLAHDEHAECSVGDIVSVSACRPVSRRKVWKLEKILEKAN